VKVLPTSIPGVLVIEPDLFEDARGHFFETYHEAKYREAGILGPFVQDNQSHSLRGVLRGLHAQRLQPQGKLVRVLAGGIFDVAVDVRPGSPTYGHWVGITLSAENRRQIYVPPGFAHGFCVTAAEATVAYKCTTLYDPNDEIGIVWNDPDLAIEWPIAAPVLSPRDAELPRLAEIARLLG
jgi:dTDP-4-dehydrorhamnose 3,5-epimerase